MFIFDIMILLTFSFLTSESFLHHRLMANRQSNFFLSRPSSSINFSSCHVRSSTTSSKLLSYHNVIIAWYLTRADDVDLSFWKGGEKFYASLSKKWPWCVDKSIFLTHFGDLMKKMRRVRGRQLSRSLSWIFNWDKWAWMRKRFKRTIIRFDSEVILGMFGYF